jgi:hypothetical protein
MPSTIGYLCHHQSVPPMPAKAKSWYRRDWSPGGCTKLISHPLAYLSTLSGADVSTLRRESIGIATRIETALEPSANTMAMIAGSTRKRARGASYGERSPQSLCNL